MPCRLSVIVPAFEADSTLHLVLAALRPQILGAEREVVVVISGAGSSPTENLGSLPPAFRILRLPERALPGQARNRGVRKARGELLAFLDADALPSPIWLDELEQALAPGIDVVGGAICNGTPDSAWGTADYLLEFVEWVPQRADPLEHAASGNLLVRRSAFERAGGFAEDMRTGEDTIFTVPFASSGALAFAPRAVVWHLNRTTAAAVLASQRRLGTGWVQVCARVEMVEGAWAVPRRVPLAIAARLLAILRRARRAGLGPVELAARAPLLLAGLLSWGWGIVEGSRSRR